MKINVLTGGPQESLPKDLYSIQEHWCGIDYGAVRLVKHGIRPILSIGDFDSSTEEELKEVQEQSYHTIYRPLKDDITDTELALRNLINIYPKIRQINIYGATGGRLDQLFANIFFILKPFYHDYVEKIYLIDRWNYVSFFLPGSHCLNRIKKMKYLAFVPLIAVSGLTLFDEKYQLPATDFNYPISLSSNEFVNNQAHFKFKSGIVMTVQSND